MTTLTKPPLGYVKVSVAARHLGVSRQRVHQLILSGDLRAKEHYRRTYVHMKSIESRIAMLAATPEDREAAPDGYLTVRQIADRFGVSRSSARNWLRSGMFPGAKLDPRNMWVAPIESVEAFQRPALGRPASS